MCSLSIWKDHNIYQIGLYTMCTRSRMIVSIAGFRLLSWSEMFSESSGGRKSTIQLQLSYVHCQLLFLLILSAGYRG